MAAAELYTYSTSANHHRNTTMSSTSGTGKRTSFFGSLKKLARTSSNKMGKTAEFSSNPTGSNTNNTTNTNRHSGSPFSNPSPATRRPRKSHDRFLILAELQVSQS
jgi:hypothetical protein